MTISHKIRFLNDFKGKTIWSTLLPLSIAFFLLFSMVSISLSQIFLSLSFIFWITFLIKEKQKFTFPSFFWPLLVYVILSLLSTAFSVNPKVSLKDNKEFLLFLIVPIIYTCFFNEKSLKKANIALLASAYLSCIYSFFQLLFKISWPEERISGLIGHTMTQSGLLLLFCCMGLSMYLFTRTRVRYIWGLGFLFSIVALVFTLTRSAWIGMFIAICLILFFYKPRILIFVPLVFIIIFLISPQPIRKRAFSIFSLEPTSNRIRFEYVAVGIKIVKDFPLFGTGPDTVEIIKQNPKYEASEFVKKGVHLHNNIIQIAAERGIPTLLSWLAFFVWVFFSLLKLLKNKDPTNRPLIIAAIAALLGLFVAGLFEYNFGDSEITSLFFYIITIPFSLDKILGKKARIKKTKKKESIKYLEKSKIFIITLIFLLFYAVWLSINILRFKTYVTPESVVSYTELEGVYHIHTSFSDGTKGVNEIVKLASSSNLDFIILTDHGSPNHESYANQGWKEGVLVLAGSELSVSRGHLVALDFDLPSQKFAQKAEHAAYEIEGAGGFSIIAHPYSKTNWSWGEFVGYSGIEIMNADSMLRKDILISLPYLPALLFSPKYAFLKFLDNPYRNLRKWEELNKIHPIYGYFSTDAHLFYRPLLESFHLHLLLQTPLSKDFKAATNQVYEALRKGRFYNSVHAAAHANGFRFWGEKGAEKILMGSETSLSSPLTLYIQAPFSFGVEIHLIHDGKNIYQSTDENSSYFASQPGTYRVEVYLKERSPLSKNIPWIISNPIFLREDNK